MDKIINRKCDTICMLLVIINSLAVRESIFRLVPFVTSSNSCLRNCNEIGPDVNPNKRSSSVERKWALEIQSLRIYLVLMVVNRSMPVQRDFVAMLMRLRPNRGIKLNHH